MRSPLSHAIINELIMKGNVLLMLNDAIDVKAICFELLEKVEDNL